MNNFAICWTEYLILSFKRQTALSESSFYISSCGPGGTANEVDKVITRHDGFIFLDGVQIIADTAPKAEISALLAGGLRLGALALLRRDGPNCP